VNIILVVLHVALALGVTGLVLLQKGKGAGEGAAFGGGGGSGSVFGASGSSNFLSRATAVLATAFFINSLVLAHLAANRDISDSVLDGLNQSVVAEEAVIPVETVDESVPVPADASADDEVPLPE
jgi:preprotein translocase subunit SecG